MASNHNGKNGKSGKSAAGTKSVKDRKSVAPARAVISDDAKKLAARAVKLAGKKGATMADIVSGLGVSPGAARTAVRTAEALKQMRRTGNTSSTRYFQV